MRLFELPFQLLDGALQTDLEHVVLLRVTVLQQRKKPSASKDIVYTPELRFCKAKSRGGQCQLQRTRCNPQSCGSAGRRTEVKTVSFKKDAVILRHVILEKAEGRGDTQTP
jgi:hypothetical protein